MNRFIRNVIACVGVALVATSCASFTVNSLPQPGGKDGYDIFIEFASVLNLPERAKVVLDGTVVGVVTDVDLKHEYVEVTSKINEDVAVPSNVRATMEQSTVLGDTYVALERPGDDRAGNIALPAGGRVPLSQTAAPPQLEDTLANLANFVGSGAIQRGQNTIIRLNNVTPARLEDLRSMVTRVTVDLSELARNIETVDKWLDGVSGTVDVMHKNLPVYDHWFSPEGMLGFDRATFSLSYIGTIAPSIGSIYSGGFWLVPLLDSMADVAGALQQSKWDFEREAPAWRKLFVEDFFPVDKYPAINITSIQGPDGREMIGDVEDVLRLLGAVP